MHIIYEQLHYEVTISLYIGFQVLELGRRQKLTSDYNLFISVVISDLDLVQIPKYLVDLTVGKLLKHFVVG